MSIEFRPRVMFHHTDGGIGYDEFEGYGSVPDKQSPIGYHFHHDGTLSLNGATNILRERGMIREGECVTILRLLGKDDSGQLGFYAATDYVFRTLASKPGISREKFHNGGLEYSKGF